MKTIWKYQLRHLVTVLDMPSGAEILTVQMQGEDLCIWALVDPSQPNEARQFHVYPTGAIEAPDSAECYVGTVMNLNDSQVWHVFEEDVE